MDTSFPHIGSSLIVNGRALGTIRTCVVVPNGIRILTDEIAYPTSLAIKDALGDLTPLLEWVQAFDPNWEPSDQSITDVVISIINDLVYPDFLSGAYISLIQDRDSEGFRVYAAIRDVDTALHAFYEDKESLKTAMKAMFVLKDLRATYWWDERLAGALTRASQMFGFIYVYHFMPFRMDLIGPSQCVHE